MRASALARSRLLNFLLFQLGWLLCVLCAAADMPVAAALGGSAVVALHLLLTRQPAREGLVLLAATLLGLLLDALLVRSGALIFPNTADGSFLPPPWMPVLWALFAATLPLSLAWLTKRMAWALLFGAIGGPLAYLAGVRLGAAAFGASYAASLAQISLAWAVAMVLLTPLARRLLPPTEESGYRLFSAPPEI